jgi:hypothetical protein
MFVLTDAPDDALDLPLAAIELIAWLRALSAAIVAAALVVPVLLTVPAGALVDCVPLALAPDVLTQISFSVSGLCQ